YRPRHQRLRRRRTGSAACPVPAAFPWRPPWSLEESAYRVRRRETRPCAAACSLIDLRVGTTDRYHVVRLGRLAPTERGQQTGYAAAQFFLIEDSDGLDRPAKQCLQQLPRNLAMLRQENLGMLGGAVIFQRVEQFLEQLLAGAQAGVDDRNFASRLLAGEADHLLGQVADLDRFAHVQGKDLAALADARRLQDQLAGLGDGHEVARYLRVGH